MAFPSTPTTPEVNTPGQAGQADNLRGIALMALAMAVYAGGDLFTKLAVARVPLPEVVLATSLGGVLIFLPLALARGHPLLTRAAFSGPVLVRGGAQVVAMVSMTAGLSLAELSTATALMQTVPLVAMLGATLFLGERVGWRRWLSVAVGITGVLVILRPAGGVEPGHLFILLGVLALAARDLATRRSDAAIPSLVLSVYSFGTVAPVAALWLVVNGGAVWPDAGASGLLLGATLGTAAGFFLVTAAHREGEVSAISPFRYTRLIIALVLSVTILGERPDLWVLLGAAMIIGSGLYALMRERALARHRAGPPPR